MDLNTILHGKDSKLFIAGGVAAGALVFYEYRKSRANAAAVAAAPVADPNAVDGGSGADVNTSGYGDYSSDTAGLFSYSDGSTGAVITGAGTSTTGTVTGPSTNAQWSQMVAAMLVQDGYDPIATAAALGHYLVGTSMSSSQYEIVQAAIALEGAPPQGAPVPKITPVAGQPGSATPDGFYILTGTGKRYNVTGGKLYQVSAKTIATQPKNTPYKGVLINNPIFALPHGNPFTI